MSTHIEAQRTRDGWKLKATLGTAVVIAAVILAWTFRLEAGIIVLGGGSAWVVRLWWVGIDAHKDRQLNRRERMAAVGVAEEKHQQEKIVTRQLELAAKIHETRIGVFFFGNQDHEPVYYPATASERKNLQPQLAAPETPKPDLLKVFTQEQGAFAIIGDQRTGKTFQAMHLAVEWLRQGIIPTIIGPKRNEGEWLKCECLITTDSKRLGMALERIVQLGHDRNAGKSKKTPLPVFLDDWFWIVQNVAYAEIFMGEAGSILRSANIIIYLILQDDTKLAFGIPKFGASLKKGYYRLYLIPELNNDGTIEPGKATGHLIAPGKIDTEKQPIDLIPGVPRCVELQPATAQATIELAEQKPGNWQAKAAGLDPQQIAEFVRLVNEEGQSRRVACEQVFNRAYAGNIVSPLKKALA